jgi:hypothetical protein
MGIQREDTLRAAGLMMASALIATVPAAAAWKEYPTRELGFVVEFPADPMMTRATYRTVLVPNGATAHIYSVREENAIYVATVVDLLDRKEEGATLLGEAEYNLTLIGDVSGQSVSRVEPGRDAVFGRFITVNCRAGRVGGQAGQVEGAVAWFKQITGVDCPTGARLTSNLFHARGRLYLISGINLPNGDNVFGPAALRFANSISFYSADGKRNAADNVKE